jgi:hypothetical protein
VAYLGGGVHVDLEGGALESLDGDLHGGEARRGDGPSAASCLRVRGKGKEEEERRRRGGGVEMQRERFEKISCPFPSCHRFRLGPLALGLGICTKGPLRFSLIPLGPPYCATGRNMGRA